MRQEPATPSGEPLGRLAFGCFALSGGYGSAAGVDPAAVIGAAVELGMNVLDTSDAYAAGENERMIGRAIADYRDRVFLTTKFGWVLDAGGTPVRRDSSPAYVRKACEASLVRLGVEHIDLYLQHRRDPETPVEATVEELVRLRGEGKIRFFGFCEVGTATLTRAGAIADVAALQTEYSLWSRDPEDELLPFCVRTGIRFMAYSPLGRGFLAGKIRSSSDLDTADFRRSHPRFEEDNIRVNVLYVDRLKTLAEARGVTVPQLALAWLLSRPWPIMPIVATRSAAHLAENAHAMELHLNDAEARQVEHALPAAEIRGARHPDEHMKTIES